MKTDPILEEKTFFERLSVGYWLKFQSLLFFTVTAAVTEKVDRIVGGFKLCFAQIHVCSIHHYISQISTKLSDENRLQSRGVS